MTIDKWTRWRAEDDLRTAKQCRENARLIRFHQGPAWRFSHRLELRRAIRFWRYYADAIRSAKQ